MDKLFIINTSELKRFIEEVLEEKLKQHFPEKKETQSEVSLISRHEVAKLFKVSTTTIDKWRRYNILPPIVKMASRVYFKRHEIMQLMHSRQRQNETNIIEP
jgi:predicted DNA-binding transcriptional regulator AlpA